MRCKLIDSLTVEQSFRLESEFVLVNQVFDDYWNLPLYEDPNPNLYDLQVCPQELKKHHKIQNKKNVVFKTYKRKPLPPMYLTIK